MRQTHLLHLLLRCAAKVLLNPLHVHVHAQVSQTHLLRWEAQHRHLSPAGSDTLQQRSTAATQGILQQCTFSLRYLIKHFYKACLAYWMNDPVISCVCFMLSESVLQQTVDTVEIGAKNVTPFPVTALLEHYCPASFVSASNNGNAKVLCIERKERMKGTNCTDPIC